jgi:integrase
VQNLAEVETRKEKAQREGTTQTANVKGKIVEFAWHMKKAGKKDATIQTRTTMLKILSERGADLLDAESVKEAIAVYQCSDGSKRVMVDAYKSFAKFLGVSWNPPKYSPSPKIPFIPLEREIDDVIACCSRRTGTLLQLLKETGARLGEALELKWTDVDFERRIVRIEPEKGSNPRISKASDKLLGMISKLPKDSSKIFGGRVKRKVFIESLNKARKKGAAKLQNPRLLQIHYHTLRHWVGTMEYHKTKDPWHVKRVLGHKSLQSTEIYINIEQVLFEQAPEEFHVKTASNPEEIKELLEVGFEYICEKDGLMFFRKRK